MASRSRWIALLAPLACDPAAPSEPSLRTIVLNACKEPTLESAIGCDAPETQAPAAETVIDPEIPGNPFLHQTSELVRAGPDLIVAVGGYGDFTNEGAWVAAIAADATLAWSAAVPAIADELVSIHAIGDVEGVWIAAAQNDDSTIARRYDLTGAQVGELVVAGFTVTSVIAQPLGAIAMTGTSSDDPAYVGVGADGTELWNGATNDAEGPYVIGDGTVQYFDGPGAAVWEEDPRGTPDPGFPIDVGIERAIVTSAGDVLAAGQVIGPLGDNTLLVRYDADGGQTWSLGRPRALTEVVLEGAMDTAIILGRSLHCSPGTYLAVFDPAAVLLQEVRIVAPPRPFAVLPDTRVASVEVSRNLLTLRTFDVEVEAPKPP